MAEELAEIRILLPKRIYEKLELAAAKHGITVNDLVLQAIVRILDEYSV